MKREGDIEFNINEKNVFINEEYEEGCYSWEVKGCYLSPIEFICFGFSSLSMSSIFIDLD